MSDVATPITLESILTRVESRFVLNEADGTVSIKKGKLLDAINSFGARFDVEWILGYPSESKTGYYIVTQEVLDNGILDVSVATAPVATQPQPAVAAAAEVVSMNEWNANHAPKAQCFVPNKIPNFRATKVYRTVRNILKSRQFFPTYLVGETGCGKTINVTHACAIEKRELIRLNFTEATSEQHIIGGYRIIGGETIWVDGPAVTAMKRGAVLLLDEVDLGSPKIMCLQSILEGSGYYNERTGEMITPQPGFQIFATANTKGQLSGSSRKYIGARAQNEAFLDRFSASIECDYMTDKEQREVLEGEFASMLLAMGRTESPDDRAFLNTAIEWIEKIAKSYKSGAFDFRISTRRACDLIRAYFIMGTVKDAVQAIVARFDNERQAALFKLFNSMHTAEINFGSDDDDDEVSED